MVLQEDVIGDAERRMLADPLRLRSVRRIIGGPRPDEAFDRVAMLVNKLVDAPMGVVCLVAEDRQYLAGQVGVPEPLATVREMSLTHSFSRHVVMAGRLLAIPDVRADPRTRDNPAIRELGALAYAGAPITDPDGLIVGTLCAVDREPRVWTPSEITLISELAEVCSSEVCLRIARVAADEARRAAESAHQQLEVLAELTESLAATMDVEEAMRRLGDIVSTRLADWCVVTIADSPRGAAHVSAAHRHADRAADMARLAELGMRSHADLDAMVRAAHRTRALRTPDGAADLRSRLHDAELAEITTRAGFGASLLVPITSPVRRETLGAVLLVKHPDRAAFTAAEERTAAEIGRRAGLAVENSRLYREQRHVAEVLQRSLLTELPAIPGVDLHARYVPAQDGAAVGGDWYDAFAQPDGSVMVAVGDVAGHDIEAAATMGQLRNLVRGDAYGRDEEPGDLLSRLDQALHGLRVPGAATAVLARVQRSWSGWAVNFASAGHPPPLLMLPDGTVQVWWVPPEPLLGLPPREPRTTSRRFVPAGSTLVLYTDGLVENRQRLLDDGVARIGEVLSAAAGRTPDELGELLLAAAPDGNDDIALLLVRLN
ncbi:putative magnesium/manganese-dependent protein phosphatase with GAF domain [Actinoplanes missouriensis 431]|uniref:Putative magnesium/manganese-dependent protein phosphatase with GAF domain n=1 Tax=Actinoplanes missouriensis (strain ATCC 14538 / DSM 43046 / CBS 188.64 / JCM 3121 / NBRC 102363 / NCIMB 12654 / NRRL B-3342 / UNCC 431) TaxID=512565 RepID=I0GZF2_ACTM4|nr:SpoIIE family protein phosphatase [Actinoplanes missouriensis]BAL86139.1 putative magnesium/manganese-dependent protein phosphatase with GAF domain [Actinoplanes missouriensis 431]